MFVLIIIVAIVLCIAIVYLPYAAGLTTIKKQSPKQFKKENSRHNIENNSGYLAPDEELRREQEKLAQSKKSSLKDRVTITSESLPIKIKLNQDGVLRKRTERTVGDLNPNNYDYDLDELIKEETEGEARRAAKEYYSKEHLGGSKEAMV